MSGVRCQEQETEKAKPETLRLGACDLRFRDVGYEVSDCGLRIADLRFKILMYFRHFRHFRHFRSFCESVPVEHLD